MEEIVGALGIKWGELFAQVVAFLIVLWILKKWAWKPILKVLEDRRQKIQSEFDGISQKKKEVETLVSDYQAKLEGIDSLARAKIQEAASEGQKLANEIRENARQDAKELVDRSREEIQRDIEKAKVQLRDDLVRISLGAAEKIMKEKMDEKKDKELISDFINQMEKLE
jgi:F-type H+-transporting ATPase subunit b